MYRKFSPILEALTAPLENQLNRKVDIHLTIFKDYESGIEALATGEVMVVVSIITLLMAMLLPAVGKARDTARVGVSRSNLRQLGVAFQSYAADWKDRRTPLRAGLAKVGGWQHLCDG